MATKIELLEALLRELSNDLSEIYSDCTGEKYGDVPPEIYGAILGLHTKIDLGLSGEYVPEKLQKQDYPNGNQAQK